MLKRGIILIILILNISLVFAISNVEHDLDGNKLTITYEGTPPFYINIRRDQNIDQPGGYVWAKTFLKSFTIDLSFANNPFKLFYYGVKDKTWSDTKKIDLIEEPKYLTFINAQPGEIPGPDIDKDGINDLWENQYGYSTSNSNEPSELNDADDDGINDREEGIQGTNPNVKDSFRITMIDIQGNDMILTMPTFFGNKYSIEGTLDLMNPNWKSLVDFYGPDADSVEVAAPMDGSIGFFRAVAHPLTTTLREASILNIPLPENSKCFYLTQETENLPECQDYYIEDPDCAGTPDCFKILACPKFYNPVYDSRGTFYPSACWAEQLGVINYEYGYSDEILQFVNDLWQSKQIHDIDKFEVPVPNIEFSYSGSGLVGFDNGAYLRSFLWENESQFWLLDYYINVGLDKRSQSISKNKNNPFIKVYGITPKALLVFLKYDNLYPNNILLEWTDTYEPLMNDYIKKKQKVSNPIQYDLIPVVIDQPTGVHRPTGEDLYFSDEELAIIYNQATSQIGQDNFDIFIISPVLLDWGPGYYTYWNDMELILASITPPLAYSNTDKKAGLDSLAAFQDGFVTISHEVLHALGLQGDHLPMGYGTTFLDYIGQGVDLITGKKINPPHVCDFYRNSPDYYAVELPENLKMLVGQEPSWLWKEQSGNNLCLGGLHNNEFLMDYDNDGEYEIMYKNNLIGVELQRSLGWLDIDGDEITELIDPEPYGKYKKIDNNWYSSYRDDFYSTFEYLDVVTIDDCEFYKIKLDNEYIGITPKRCSYFNNDITNLYLGLKYIWYEIDSGYGLVLIPHLATL